MTAVVCQPSCATTLFDSGRSGCGGHGLGLGIVREILAAHDGEVTLRAETASSGACFEWLLPVTRVAPREPDEIA